MRSVVSIAVLGVLVGAGLVVAQGPTLTASGNAGATPPTVTLTVSGAPANAHVILAASLQQGTGQFCGLTLGIAPPWIFMYMGVTDAAGSLSQTYNLNPASLPSPLPGTIAYCQGGVVTMTMTGGGTPGGGGMGGGGTPGGGGMGGGGMGGGGTPGGGMGGSTTMGGMTVTLTNVASFTF